MSYAMNRRTQDATRAAVWNWDASDGMLDIRAQLGGPLRKLDGHWRLELFLNEVDGLARMLVRSALTVNGAVGDPIDVRFSLQDGRAARIVGTFYDAGCARGLIVDGEGDDAPVQDAPDVVPVFQPIRRLSDLSVAGFEALARFRAADGRLIGSEALPALGREADWVGIAPTMLRTSAALLAEQRARGRDLFMQVNLSAAEISRPLLVEEIARAIASAGLPRGVLRIELTEQAALRDHEAALGALAAFRAAGAGVVLDDFGAGHSSFAWLAEIPAEGVKLDAKLTQMVRHARGGKIVGGLTAIIRSLGMTVTAEGVEDGATAPELQAIGCDYVQGFAFDLPLQASDVERAFQVHAR